MSDRHQARVRTPLAAALALLLATAAASPTAARSVVRLPAHCEGGPPALAEAPAVAFLPRDTVFALAVRDPAGLLATLGWETLRAELGEIARETREHTGHDLTDPASWEAVGLDTHGSAGFAVLDLEDESIALWATVRDRGAFRAFLDGIATSERDRFDVAEVGDALVLQPARDKEIGFVFRGDVVFFTVSDRGDAEGRRAARLVAETPPDESLAASAEAAALLQALSFGRDVAGYLDVGPVLRAALGFPPPPSRERLGRLARQLDGARNVDPDGYEVRWLRDRIAEERRRLGPGDVGPVDEAPRVETTYSDAAFGALGGVAFGLETRPRWIGARVVADLPDDGPLARLLRPGDGPPALLRALGEAPLHLAYARLDIDALLAFAADLASAAGSSWDETTRLFRRDTGIDLGRDVAEIFSGEVGLAVTGRPLAALDDEPTPRATLGALGGTVALGLRSPDRARALLSRLFTTGSFGPMLRQTADGWVLDIPGWKPVHIVVTADQLVVTTDAALPQRLARGAAGAWFEGLAGTPLGGLLADDRAAALWVADLGQVAFLALHDTMDESLAEYARGGEEAPDAPHSDAWKRLAQERATVVDRLERLRAERREKRRRHLRSLVEGFGTTAFVGRAEEGRLVSCGGQFFPAPDLAAFVSAATADLAALLRLEESRHEVWQLEDRRWQLERRLQEQRQQDIERWREGGHTTN